MSLTLIGLGLYSERDLSLNSIEEAKNSDIVYIELYTSKWYGNLNNLEKIIGKEVTELKRKDLEENSSKIVEEEVTLAVQVNGKVRAEMKVDSGISESEVKEKALQMPEIIKWTEGKEILRLIYVPNKVLNIVI